MAKRKSGGPRNVGRTQQLVFGADGSKKPPGATAKHRGGRSAMKPKIIGNTTNLSRSKKDQRGGGHSVTIR